MIISGTAVIVAAVVVGGGSGGGATTTVCGLWMMICCTSAAITRSASIIAKFSFTGIIRICPRGVLLLTRGTFFDCTYLPSSLSLGLERESSL